MEKICVAIRVRPPSKTASPAPFLKGHKWSVGAHNVALYSNLGTPVNGQNYSFDHVFGTDAKNGDIYRGLTKDVIMSSVDGFNGTVFAYGQTSSGKTYTMKGTPTDPGIIRLAVHDVFTHIRQTNDREFLIRVSYMEIYNEDINDLFAPDNRRLRVHENLEKGIFVAGLREEIVDSPEQVFDLLEFGESHRHFGETNMNLYSSRSHTIFRMVIESRDTSQDGIAAEVSSDAVRVSCLNMVDLAGSERIAKTGAGGVRLKEGMHINKSLMTLGTVINKLSDGTGKQGGHIPYRDSKLTRILQPALGGNAKTAMICTVTPDEIHIDETRGTLQFASRAKRVSTCAQVNEIVTDAALLKRQTKEIEDLRMKLQGLPQSAQLEKEILTLRNELLKFELEKERLYLELQEEKRAQVDRERRIKEQEQKIENLNTLFMSSNLDDRDGEKLPKKVNRRETWCPRQLSSEIGVQDFRKSTDQTEDDETMDNILFSMRRDRNFTLPPAFEIDEEIDPFWPGSNEIEEPEPPSDFENIADEDTWMTLNKGHTTTSTVFAPGFSERNRSSTGSGTAQKVASLESQLRDLQMQNKELQSSCDIKLKEATKELTEEIQRIKLQLDNVKDENLTLKNELSAQLEVQRELQYVFEDLEFEMDATRLQTASMQGILAESLHVQANILVTIQDCITVPSTKGKHPSLGSKAKEKRLLVESSVQQCRKICAEVENVLQDRPPRIHETTPQSSIEVLEAVANGRSLGENANDLDMRRYAIEPAGVDGGPSIQVSGQPSLVDILTSSSATREVKYCEGCMSSILSTSKMWSNEQAVLYNSAPPTFQKDGAGEKSGGMSSLERCEGTQETLEPAFDAVDDSLSCVPSNGLRAHTLRALASQTATHSELGTSSGRTGGDHTDPNGIWSELISCDHAGCSFGTLGRNCDQCVNHERAIMGKNQIPTAMNKLCSLILRLFEPSFPVLESVREQRNQDSGVQQAGDLKTKLASAKLLATWLLEEIQVIVGHDVGCLSCHVKEGGNVGILLEGLEVLLLQIANLAVGLLQVTCGQDEGIMKDLLLQLSTLKDPHNSMGSVSAKETQPVDIASETLPQGDTTVQKVPQPIFEVTDTEGVETIVGSLESYSSIFPDRVLKVESVEEVLGKVLENSMVLLSKEHRVMKGDPMLLVLTLELKGSPEAASNVLHEKGVKIQQIRFAPTCKSFQHSRWIPQCRRNLRPGGAQQLVLWGGVEGDSTCHPCCKAGETDHRSMAGSRDVTERQMGLRNHSSVRVKCELVELSLCELESVIARNSGHWVEELDGHINDKFAAQLLLKTERVRKLEMNLAAAELEIVELKIELEDLRAKLQTHGDISQNDSVQQMQSQLQAYKDKCASYEEEIRVVLDKSAGSAENLQKERLMMAVMEENQFLQDCLSKAKKHALRSKAWRDEIRKWKDIETTRREATTEAQILPANDSRASLNESRIESKAVDDQQPQSAMMHVEPPPLVPKSQADVKGNDVRPARSALRVLDLNARGGCPIDPHDHPKRRRQLQFQGDENCLKGSPNP